MEKLKNIKKLLSNTPLVDIEYRFNNEIKHVYAKCEWFSLTGSIKDKAAYQIFYDAFINKKLKKGDIIADGFSTNGVTIIMPKNMSDERKHLIRLYGATLVEVDNFKEAFILADEYVKQGYFCTNQFANESNAKAHRNITAKEIYSKLKKLNVEAFVSGVGTSGTLSGIGKVLKDGFKNNCNRAGQSTDFKQTIALSSS